jgi:CRP/FNR family transcriptional regulator, anaerobic regulatory protein
MPESRTANQSVAEQLSEPTSDNRCADCDVRMVSVCAALETNELCALDSLARQVTFEPKSTLYTQGDPANSVYNVTEGVVRLYKLLPDGKRQIVGFAIPGDFLGLAMADRFDLSADAVQSVNVCRFSREDFSNFVDEKPHLLRRLHEFATHELSLAQDQMVVLGRRTAEEKVASFLIGLRNRLSRIGRTSVTVPLPMSRQDIADFLGLTIETVSRIFARLAREKAILIVPDGVRILNLPRMEQLAAT